MINSDYNANEQMVVKCIKCNERMFLDDYDY